MRSTRESIRSLLLASMSLLVLTGCGVNKAEHETVKSKLKEAETVISQKDAELTQLQSSVQALKQQVGELENSDIFTYAKILPLEKSGDLAKAKQLYELFLASFPASLLISDAKAAIERINKQEKETKKTTEAEPKKKDEAAKPTKTTVKANEKTAVPEKKKTGDSKSPAPSTSTSPQKRFTPLKNGN